MRSFFATDIDRLRAPRGDAVTSATTRTTTTGTGTGTRHGAGCDSETD